jgi:hypothetical protein
MKDIDLSLMKRYVLTRSRRERHHIEKRNVSNSNDHCCGRGPGSPSAPIFAAPDRWRLVEPRGRAGPLQLFRDPRTGLRRAGGLHLCLAMEAARRPGAFDLVAPLCVTSGVVLVNTPSHARAPQGDRCAGSARQRMQRAPPRDAAWSLL